MWNRCFAYRLGVPYLGDADFDDRPGTKTGSTKLGLAVGVSILRVSRLELHFIPPLSSWFGLLFYVSPLAYAGSVGGIL